MLKIKEDKMQELENLVEKAKAEIAMILVSDEYAEKVLRGGENG